MTLVPGLAGLRPSYRRLLGAPVPLALYRALYGTERHGFLYESLEAHGTRGRFSFLGGRPLAVLRGVEEGLSIEAEGEVRTVAGHPLRLLRTLLRSGADALPVATFPGGAVGYLGWELVRLLGPVPVHARAPGDLPDLQLLVPGEVLIVDHLDEVVHVLLYGADAPRVRAIEEHVRASDSASEDATRADLDDASPTWQSGTSQSEYEQAVLAAQEHILAGDILQVVLSQRLEFEASMPPLDLYAALRATNPSPYMYYLSLDGLHVAGSSPEVLVKLTGRRVVTRPLAGTRPRGATPAEDAALAQELSADPKERAEHVMLVDLARNDLGRVCRTGSVQVGARLAVERCSRVMHLVSEVTGRLREDRDAIDVLEAAFPAGTVSGAPKIRAMQILHELEGRRRGPYGGAIGYFSFLGDMDLCIGIRTLVVADGRGVLQVGAGIVADSVPEREYQETLNKARGLLQAIQLAGSPRFSS